MQEMKFIKKLIVFVAIGLLFVFYGRYIEQRTIESARLETVTENGYTISFDGQIHEYEY